MKEKEKEIVDKIKSNLKYIYDNFNSDENLLTEKFIEKCIYENLTCYSQVTINDELWKPIWSCSNLSEKNKMLFNLIFIILDSKKSYIPDSLIIYDDYYIFLEFKKDNTDSDCGFDCWKILFYHFIFWVLKSIIHCNDEPIFIKKKGG